MAEITNNADQQAKSENSAPATSKKAAKAKEEAKSWLDDRVTFLAPIDFSNPKDKELVIIVNGYEFRIRRGEEVQLPRNAVQVYYDSQNQKAKSLGLQEKYEKMVNLTDGEDE